MASLSLIYVLMLIPPIHALGFVRFVEQFLDFNEVVKLFQSPDGVVVGWIHFAVTDLAAGLWLISDSRSRQIRHLFMIPQLLVSLLFGPAGVDLLEMCFDLNLPPCHVLRQVLIALNLGLTQNKRTITEVMKDPPSLLSLVSIEVAQETLQQRNSIPEGTDAATAAQAFLSRLIKDVTLCVDCDTNYGPSSDAARHFAGDEYEVKLYDALGAAGIAYWTEKNLRDTGHHKTPDARLRVPIAVNGRIICWIDSKATFGDEGQHASYRELQYEKYSNRYGPGMVIYWHGYLADLQKLEENVLLVDKFPQSGEIATLPQLPLDATEGGGGGGKARGRLNFREDNGIEP
ncbi:putative CDAN1-interacting nuclease 1 [Nannochloris sp. 'desiccata']|nr:hypothetical protein KSW81_005778 [Chlorella desiccata (nom. nud.)]KAH7623311.1 putative CDAN1-interacting nuclease 1 [Chlorella desiccata (nom. nud.)]